MTSHTHLQVPTLTSPPPNNKQTNKQEKATNNGGGMIAIAVWCQIFSVL